jgi:hypothetical protein
LNSNYSNLVNTKRGWMLRLINQSTMLEQPAGQQVKKRRAKHSTCMQIETEQHNATGGNRNRAQHQPDFVQKVSQVTQGATYHKHAGQILAGRLVTNWPV